MRLGLSFSCLAKPEAAKQRVVQQTIFFALFVPFHKQRETAIKNKGHRTVAQQSRVSVGTKCNFFESLNVASSSTVVNEPKTNFCLVFIMRICGSCAQCYFFSKHQDFNPHFAFFLKKRICIEFEYQEMPEVPNLLFFSFLNHRMTFLCINPKGNLDALLT